MSKAAKVMIGKTSTGSVGLFWAIFSTKMSAFRSNISTNCSKILKWNAGVIARRRPSHFFPVWIHVNYI